MADRGKIVTSKVETVREETEEDLSTNNKSISSNNNNNTNNNNNNHHNNHIDQIDSFTEMTKKKISSRSPSPNSPSERLPRPPGPAGLPGVGLIFHWEGPHTNLEWTRQYGGIYQVQMGSKQLVYLNTVELVERYMEGPNGERFLDRPMGPAAIGQGLLFGSGEPWKKNKHAFKKAFHAETFTKHLEEAVQHEIQITMETLHNNVNTPIKIGDFLLPTCANAIAGLLRGENLPCCSHDREELLHIAKNVECVDLTSFRTQMSLNHPKLAKIASKLGFSGHVDIYGTSRRLQNLLRSWIRECNSNPLSPGPLSPTSPRFDKTFSQLELATAGTPITPDDTDGVCPFKKNPKRLRITPKDHTTETTSTTTSSPSPSTSSTTSSQCTERPSCPIHMQSPQQQKQDESHFNFTPPQDSSLIESAMINATHLVAFGFTDTGPGEQAFEQTEPLPKQGLSPYSPAITEKTWTFSKQMSLNITNDSILKRILNQPAFKGVTEETDAELLQSLIDMFFGGVTSTLSGLEYILIHLVREPAYQRRAQEEVDAHVTSNDGMITWSMQKDMHYIRSCITEALRLGSVTPSSLPHIATEDTEIEGYSIPKGTFVLGSIYSLHHDREQYLDPDAFRPQRHLSSQMQYKKPTSFKPYGIGARKCVGVSISEMQLFIYTVYILRHFELQPISEETKPSLDSQMRIIHRLKDFRCILRPRDVV